MAMPALPHASLREVLMVNLAPPPKDWLEAISAAAKEFMGARVCFYKDDGKGDLDPLTGSGSEGGIELIWVGPARAQQLRAPHKFSTEYQAGSSRSFRFQMDKDGGVPFLPQGVKGRVLSAGVQGDVSLERLVYSVDSAINSSTQAVRTVELTSNMRGVDWEWDVDADGNVV